MSLSDRLKKLEARHEDVTDGNILILPDNGRGTPEETARHRAHWAEFKRTGVPPRGCGILITPQDDPEHPSHRRLPTDESRHCDSAKTPQVTDAGN